MNRRSLLLFSTLLGALFPLRALAQDSAKRSAKSRRVSDATDDPLDARDPEAERDEIPPSLPTEAGRIWKRFDIGKYTNLPHKENNPQTSIVDWILRSTSTATWHGEKIAVLSAGRNKIQAYHDPKTIDKVGQVVERFVDAQYDFLSLRVRFVAAADTRWRYQVFRRLNLVGSGPQGQQIWSLSTEDAAMVLTQMQVWQGFRLLAERKFDMVNGQTLFMETSSPRPFTGGMQRDSAVGQGFQPKTEELVEGVTLRLSPLLSYEGDALDAAIELTANTVRSFHQTRVLAPREVGPGELRIDVPEVSETRLNQTVKDWPVGKTLLISAGIHPGILQSKAGVFRIPGTMPTSTELLIFIDVEIADEKPTRRVTAKGRTRR